MKHTFFTQKELVIDGKKISAGEVLVTVTTEIPLDRALNAITIGAAGLNKPASPVEAPIVDASTAGEPAKQKK